MRPQKSALEVYADTFIEAFQSRFPGVYSEQASQKKAERKRGLDSPAEWVRGRLGEHVWSKQAEILNSVRDHRRTAVRSCHAAGKSFIAARIAAWWIECHEPGEAFAVTSAPSAPQVRAVLWREMARAHSKGRLTGRMNQTEWLIPQPYGKEELVAMGRKPADMDQDAFQGIHADYVLVIFDEASGMPDALWEAADSLIANEDSRFLAIGNPTDPTSSFADVCKPGSGWNVIGISAFDTPNFTGELVPENLHRRLVSQIYVDEQKKKWGKDGAGYVSRVLGEFPKVKTGGLIPYHWVEAAQQRKLDPGMPSELGVDVGAGGDKSVVAHRRGPVVRIIRKDQNPDTMETCGNIIADTKEKKSTLTKVDEVGIGRGIVDRAKELEEEGKVEKDVVVGVNVGQPPKDKEAFVNLRAEGYWALRERFQSGDIDIDAHDDEIAAQLVDLRFKRTSRGQIQIESKDDIKRRGRPSPDDADAVMLAFLDPPETDETNWELMRQWLES